MIGWPLWCGRYNCKSTKLLHGDELELGLLLSSLGGSQFVLLQLFIFFYLLLRFPIRDLKIPAKIFVLAYILHELCRNLVNSLKLRSLHNHDVDKTIRAAYAGSNVEEDQCSNGRKGMEGRKIENRGIKIGED